MARSSQQDQVVVFMNDWESFGTKANADAYDKNIRWLASHPWIQIVTPDQIANNQVDTSVPPDGAGDAFGFVDRGTGLTLPLVAQDFIDHATEENYNNWYYGSAYEESLSNKTFNVRPGAPMPRGVRPASGRERDRHRARRLGQARVDPSGGGSLLKLARGVYHASLFETAFHNNTSNALDKFSTGAYIYPDTSYMTLADFAAQPQAQTRESAILARVQRGASAAAGGSYQGAAVAEAADIDLDGEPEYLLYNDRLFAVFERIGGRMTGAWIRDLDTNQIFQVAGNFLSAPGAADETEGNTNVASGAAASLPHVGFKDWYAVTSATSGTNQYVNDLYTVGVRRGRHGLDVHEFGRQDPEDDHARRAQDAIGSERTRRRRVDGSLRAVRIVAEPVRPAPARADGLERDRGWIADGAGCQSVRHRFRDDRARLSALRRRRLTTRRTTARRRTAAQA